MAAATACDACGSATAEAEGNSSLAASSVGTIDPCADLQEVLDGAYEQRRSNTRRTRLNHELERGCQLRDRVLEQIESVLERYHAQRKVLSLLTQQEAECLKAGKVHTMMISQLLRGKGTKHTEDLKGEAERELGTDVVLMQCQDLLEHQLDLKVSLLKELSVKKRLLEQKRAAKDDVKQKVDSLGEKVYKQVQLVQDGSGAQEASAQKSHLLQTLAEAQADTGVHGESDICIDRREIARNLATQDMDADDWMRGLRAASEVTLSDVLRPKQALHSGEGNDGSDDGILQEGDILSDDEFRDLRHLTATMHLAQDLQATLTSTTRPFTDQEKYDLLNSVPEPAPPTPYVAPPRPPPSPPLLLLHSAPSAPTQRGLLLDDGGLPLDSHDGSLPLSSPLLPAGRAVEQQGKDAVSSPVRSLAPSSPGAAESAAAASAEAAAEAAAAGLPPEAQKSEVGEGGESYSEGEGEDDDDSSYRDDDLEVYTPGGFEMPSLDRI